MKYQQELSIIDILTFQIQTNVYVDNYKYLHQCIAYQQHPSMTLPVNSNYYQFVKQKQFEKERKQERKKDRNEEVKEHCHLNTPNNDLLIDWSKIDSLIDWLFDWQTVWLTDRFINW